MKRILTLLFLAVTSIVVHAQVVMQPEIKNSAAERWLAKKVLDRIVLDEMDNTSGWTPFTNGAIQVVDARETAKINKADRMVTGLSVSAGLAHGTGKSLLMKLPTKLEGPGPENGRGWGTAGIKKSFGGEDWRAFNRLSLWIYPDCPGAWQNWLELTLFNDGEEKLPALFAQEGETTILLKNHEWNHVVWEIGNVARDRITGFQVSSWMPGNEPEASDTVAYYFDEFELQKVDPDYTEGWAVWPGRIAYCHTGYQTGAPKSALTSGLNATSFRIIDAESGKTVLEKPVKNLTNKLGTFQELDFTELNKTGNYIIEAGELKSQAFPVSDEIWEGTIWKALNFFYSERCGQAIPGVHGVCHRDWTCVHGNKSIVINGGWHDAGDFTQGMGNTGEAAYAMFSLAENLKQRDGDKNLIERLTEEGKWGLDWILKTSFGDGFRNDGSINSRRTDGIIGTDDDVRSTARNNPKTNLVAAATEAIAARLLKDSDPRLAAYSLKMAEADWLFAIEGLKDGDPSAKQDIVSGAFDSGRILHDIPSACILAAGELYQATGKKMYEDEAVRMATIICSSQQKKKTDWDVPLSGFFYTGPDKEHLLHYCHRGREQAPVLALAMLCRLFPDNPDWMKWYTAVALHSEYLKQTVQYTEPYGFTAASVYSDKEYLLSPPTRMESYRQQVLNGIPLGKGYYLRLFPVWMDYRGHFGTILPQAQALVNAARLRGDIGSSELAMNQLQWITGRNPFSQSMMYGEGYDFTPLYTPSSGDIVGALPVGIQTRGDRDVPYWPVQSTWTYKEVWVHPVTQWIWLMNGAEGPALLHGRADNPVEFKNIATGEILTAIPDNARLYSIKVPQGKYLVSYKGLSFSTTILASEARLLDFDQNSSAFFDMNLKKQGSSELTISVTVTGKGEHSISLRTENLLTGVQTRKISLVPGKTAEIKWKCRIVSPDEPWIAVAVMDNDMGKRKELMGKNW